MIANYFANSDNLCPAGGKRKSGAGIPPIYTVRPSAEAETDVKEYPKLPTAAAANIILIKKALNLRMITPV